MAGKVALFLGFALFLFIHNSAAQTVHTVGDTTGWTTPPTPDFYTTWAAKKTFLVGDSLVFNFTTNMDEVSRVPKSSFDLCSDDNEIGESIETGPATIVLDKPGEYYFISSEDKHCQQGQKFAINVTGDPKAPTPTSANAPPKTPGPAPVTHIVGDALGWTIPPGGAASYVNWTSGKTFNVGDSLSFNFTSKVDDVVRVAKKSFDLCSDDEELGEESDVSPAIVLLSVPGEYYFISSEDGHCQKGQKLAINVTGSAAGPPSTAGPAPAPVKHVVGDAAGWTVRKGDVGFFTNWTVGKIFSVGDTLEFNFPTDVHDVERVPKSSFDTCSDEGEIGSTMETSPATFLLSTPDDYYFISSENNDCQQGLKLAITNVVDSRANDTTSSGTLTPGGSSSSTPGATGSPPSSANIVAAALSATFLGLVLNLF